MSLEKLTEDLSNFKWTSYEKAGEGKSPQQDGTNYFERPNPKSLEGMETKFGPIDTISFFNYFHLINSSVHKNIFLNN